MGHTDLFSTDPVSLDIAASKTSSSEEEALTFARTALQEAIRQGLHQEALIQQARALLNISEREAEWRRYDAARLHAEKCLDLSSHVEKRAGRAIKASALNNLALRLADLGHYSEALMRASQATEIWQSLSAKDPAYSAQWARGLATLAVRQSEVGRIEEAVQSAERAVALCRGGVGFAEDERNAELGSCLNALALLYAQVGRRQEALDPATEVVDIRRTASQMPGAGIGLSVRYARALSNLSALQSELGLGDAAVESANEAVGVLRGVGSRAAGPALAAALNNLSVAMASIDRQDDAARAATEAVECFRAMGGESPGSFESDLASSLNTLAIRLSKAGDWAGALKAAEEAVGLRRHLMAAYPAANAGALATELHTLSRRLRDVGRLQSALEAIDESIVLWRQLQDGAAPAYQHRLDTAVATKEELEDAIHAALNESSGVDPRMTQRDGPGEVDGSIGAVAARLRDLRERLVKGDGSDKSGGTTEQESRARPGRRPRRRIVERERRGGSDREG
ncbi:tetratricopeptide repeat protein [Humibacillus xanthopallidus]|uniref:Tetratricopeptide repeat protein n=1 Tax=Humibacillus xanthopallidus TaxID=412689 RepID=A0A543PUH1_9MICO|nr:tetratricopeptide repeat protein [Humibacillus xanthopallidus]TQN47721.1 tetratricopeptide repeat protein [Humibacillus xanthopallidus]